MWPWFSIFLEIALVSRVSRRFDTRSVRLLRSMSLVETCSAFGTDHAVLPDA